MDLISAGCLVVVKYLSGSRSKTKSSLRYKPKQGNEEAFFFFFLHAVHTLDALPLAHFQHDRNDIQFCSKDNERCKPSLCRDLLTALRKTVPTC